MKKRKLKKSIINLIVAILCAGIAVFLSSYFDLWQRVESLFYKNNTNIPVYVDTPKVKIVDEDSKTRVVGVSINNNHAAWPHAGLQDAYLTYELIAEGGITRLLAFYKDQNTEKIGSVRSARHYFLDYIMENDAIFVHYGYSPQAQEDIKTLSINNINGITDSSPFYRDKSLKRAYEHTAFTTMERINKAIDKYSYRKESDKMLLSYSPMKINFPEDDSIQSADNVKIVYSDYQNTSYKYDKENRVYKMYMSSKEHTDMITGKQYTVKNIITYQVKNVPLGSEGRQDLKNIGTGEGYYITNGKAIKIKWEKKNRSSQTKYMYQNGEEIVFNDGNTWIHIQPSGKKITIE